MTFDKRTAALGLAAAAAVTAAVVVTLTNHSSGASAPRKRVGDYITRVDAVQNDMQAPLARVLLAYKDFVGQRVVRHDPRPELPRAAKTLERLDRRLTAIPAPAEAKTLRSLLLRLVAKQVSITREVQAMAVFTPRFTRLLQQAHAASTTLGAALAAITIPKPHALKGTKAQVLAAERQYQAEARAAATAQADAIDAYGTAVSAILRQLTKLRPPLVFQPGYDVQVRALRSVASSGAKLAAELRLPNRSDISQLGRRFTISTRIAQSTAAQKAQIAAIRRYNARARAVQTAASRVQAELIRLQQHLP